MDEPEAMPRTVWAMRDAFGRATGEPQWVDLVDVPPVPDLSVLSGDVDIDNLDDQVWRRIISPEGP